MNRRSGFVGLASSILLTGCLSGPIDPPEQPSDTVWDGECQARPAAWAVGLTATEDIIERAWNDSKARFVRVIEPDQAVTMEFNGERVNFDLDRDGVIRGVRCG